MKEIVIRSEEDAYNLLQSRALNELDLREVSIRFDGWPQLKIHVIGEKYNQTITPTMMKGFLELQQAIYRSYTLSKYNSPNIRLLKKEEREELEIEIRVSDGSSNYEINLQELFLKLIEMVGAKMDPVHVVTMVVSIAVLFFGNSAIRSYLENRKEIREKELKSEEQRAQIEALKFTSEEETKRAKIIADIVKKEPQIENIEKTAHDAQTSLIKSMSSSDEAELQGISIDPEVAHILVTNARKRSEEIRLDGGMALS